MKDIDSFWNTAHWDRRIKTFLQLWQAEIFTYIGPLNGVRNMGNLGKI